MEKYGDEEKLRAAVNASTKKNPEQRFRAHTKIDYCLGKYVVKKCK